MHIAFLTGHAAGSKRKTGFHFWADIASSKGDTISWITLGQSRLSAIARPGKMPEGPYNQWIDHSAKIKSYKWIPLIHPVKAGPFTDFLLPLFSAFYPALAPSDMLQPLKDADIIIVETGAGLMLVPRLARECPKAKLIYYCSDRLQTLGAHPAIAAAEKTALPFFSLVRTNASARIADFPAHPNVRYIPQGIDKAQFDRDHPNPYTGPRNIITVGDMLFDSESVTRMARALPDWSFHLFGRGSRLDAKLANVTEYGERAYDDIIPYLKHADIGLAPYRHDADSAYLAESSLKIVQYTYCCLPVVATSFIAPAAHIKRYEAGDTQGMIQAVKDAAAFERHTIERGNIPDWTDVYKDMLEALS